MGSELSGTYSNYSLRMQLEHSVDDRRLLATTENYPAQLRARDDIPEPLKQLIVALFRRGAITKCSITYGRRMDLALARTNARGHLLLSEGALKHFQMIFAEIAGRPMVATWESSGSASSRRGSSDVDLSGLALGFARLFDAVCDGLVVAAAVDQLFGSD